MSAALRSFETQWRARTPDALQPIREQAMQRFLKLGLPSRRDETWRYTDLRSLAALSYGEAGCAAPPPAPFSPRRKAEPTCASKPTPSPPNSCSRASAVSASPSGSAASPATCGLGARSSFRVAR